MQKSKSIGKFDYNEYVANIKLSELETARQAKLIGSLQKNVSDLKLSCQQSYASATQGEPLKSNVVTTSENSVNRHISVK